MAEEVTGLPDPIEPCDEHWLSYMVLLVLPVAFRALPVGASIHTLHAALNKCFHGDEVADWDGGTTLRSVVGGTTTFEQIKEKLGWEAYVMAGVRLLLYHLSQPLIFHIILSSCFSDLNPIQDFFLGVLWLHEVVLYPALVFYACYVNPAFLLIDSVATEKEDGRAVWRGYIFNPVLTVYLVAFADVHPKFSEDHQEYVAEELTLKHKISAVVIAFSILQTICSGLAVFFAIVVWIFTISFFGVPLPILLAHSVHGFGGDGMKQEFAEIAAMGFVRIGMMTGSEYAMKIADAIKAKKGEQVPGDEPGDEASTKEML